MLYLIVKLPVTYTNCKDRRDCFKERTTTDPPILAISNEAAVDPFLPKLSFYVPHLFWWVEPPIGSANDPPPCTLWKETVQQMRQDKLIIINLEQHDIN